MVNSSVSIAISFLDEQEAVLRNRQKKRCRYLRQRLADKSVFLCFQKAENVFERFSSPFQRISNDQRAQVSDNKSNPPDELKYRMDILSEESKNERKRTQMERCFQPSFQAVKASGLNSSHFMQFLTGNRTIHIFLLLFTESAGESRIKVDLARKVQETAQKLDHPDPKEDVCDELFEALASEGMFVLASSVDLPVEEILPVYYTRQQVEQTFDSCKNYTDLLPLRIESEDNLRGPLLLTFIASCIVRRIQNRFWPWRRNGLAA